MQISIFFQFPMSTWTEYLLEILGLSFWGAGKDKYDTEEIIEDSVWSRLTSVCVPSCGVIVFQAVFLYLFPCRVQGSLNTTGRDVSLCAKTRRDKIERFNNSSLPWFWEHI